MIKEVPVSINKISTDQVTEEDMTATIIKSAIDGIKENQSKTLEMFQTILTEQNKQTAQLLALLSDNFGGEQNPENATAVALKIPASASPTAPPAKVSAYQNIKYTSDSIQLLKDGSVALIIFQTFFNRITLPSES